MHCACPTTPSSAPSSKQAEPKCLGRDSPAGQRGAGGGSEPPHIHCSAACTWAANRVGVGCSVSTECPVPGPWGLRVSFLARVLQRAGTEACPLLLPTGKGPEGQASPQQTRALQTRRDRKAPRPTGLTPSSSPLGTHSTSQTAAPPHR